MFKCDEMTLGYPRTLWWDVEGLWQWHRDFGKREGAWPELAYRGNLWEGGVQKDQTNRSVSFYLIKMIARLVEVSNTIDKRCLGSEVSRYSHLAKTLIDSYLLFSKKTAPTTYISNLENLNWYQNLLNLAVFNPIFDWQYFKIFSFH